MYIDTWFTYTDTQLKQKAALIYKVFDKSDGDLFFYISSEHSEIWAG